METRDIKLAVVGEAGVGKSALVVRFITGRFLHHYNPTLEDEYSCKMDADGRQHNMVIMDTAGQDKDNLRYYYKSSDVIMAVFSLGTHSSLDSAIDLLHCCNSLHKSNSRHNKSSTPRLPVVLVGTKSDLREREVTYEEAKATASAIGCTYIETSSAMNCNVNEAFKTAVNVAERCRPNRLSELEGSYDCGCSVIDKKIQSSAKKSVKGLLKRFKTFRKEKELLRSLRPEQ